MSPAGTSWHLLSPSKLPASNSAKNPCYNAAMQQACSPLRRSAGFQTCRIADFQSACPGDLYKMRLYETETAHPTALFFGNTQTFLRPVSFCPAPCAAASSNRASSKRLLRSLKPMTLELIMIGDRYPLSLGERVRVRDRLVLGLVARSASNMWLGLVVARAKPSRLRCPITSSKSGQNPYKSDHFHERQFSTAVTATTYNVNTSKCTDFPKAPPPPVAQTNFGCKLPIMTITSHLITKGIRCRRP
jgi:hypothetical protein